MRVLVTGPEGFVGRHLCEGLAAAGHEVVEAPGPGTEEGVDIRDATRLGALLHSVRPQAVVHLAAASSVGTTVACGSSRDTGTMKRLDRTPSRSERPRMSATLAKYR